MGSGACYQVPERLFPLLCGVPAPVSITVAALPAFAVDGLYSMHFQILSAVFGHHIVVAVTGGEATVFQAWVGDDGYTLSHWLNPAGNQVRAGAAPAHFVDAHRHYSPAGGDYVNNPVVQFGNFRDGLANVSASWRAGNHDEANNAWAHVSGVLTGGRIVFLACMQALELHTRFHAFSVGTAAHLAGPAPVLVIPPPGPPVPLAPPGPPPLHLAPPLPVLGPPAPILGPPVPPLPGAGADVGGNIPAPNPKDCCVIL